LQSGDDDCDDKMMFLSLLLNSNDNNVHTCIPLYDQNFISGGGQPEPSRRFEKLI